jgi:hypothetical protein
MVELLPNKGALVQTLDTVIAAVRAGELDEILAQQAKIRVMPIGGSGQPHRYGESGTSGYGADRSCCSEAMVVRC